MDPIQVISYSRIDRKCCWKSLNKMKMQRTWPVCICNEFNYWWIIANTSQRELFWVHGGCWRVNGYSWASGGKLLNQATCFNNLVMKTGGKCHTHAPANTRVCLRERKKILLYTYAWTGTHTQTRRCSCSVCAHTHTHCRSVGLNVI